MPCQGCGRINRFDAIFCDGCGTKLIDPSPLMESDPTAGAVPNGREGGAVRSVNFRDSDA